jgi:hypothetical protein
MSRERTWGGMIGLAATAVVASGLSGCYGLLHPLQCERPPAPVACTGPANCHDHFYTYAINGLDPMCFGNLCGLCDYVRDLGFPHTKMVQFWNTEDCHQEILAIRQKDPEARFALWGYSLGANYVRKLANELNDDGVPVELLIYIGGDTVRDGPTTRPPNVHKIVNIMGDGLIFLGRNIYCYGEDIEGAENYRHKFVRHICIPSRKHSIEMVEAATIEACDHPVPNTMPAVPPESPHPTTTSSAKTVAAEISPYHSTAAVGIIHQVDQVRPKY